MDIWTNKWRNSVICEQASWSFRLLLFFIYIFVKNFISWCFSCVNISQQDILGYCGQGFSQSFTDSNFGTTLPSSSERCRRIQICRKSFWDFSSSLTQEKREGGTLWGLVMCQRRTVQFCRHEVSALESCISATDVCMSGMINWLQQIKLLLISP